MYIIYQRSIEIDNAAVNFLEPFILYDVGSGEVYALPTEMVSRGVKCIAAGERTSTPYIPSVGVAYVSNQRATSDDATSAYVQYYGLAMLLTAKAMSRYQLKSPKMM